MDASIEISPIVGDSGIMTTAIPQNAQIPVRQKSVAPIQPPIPASQQSIRPEVKQWLDKTDALMSQPTIPQTSKQDVSPQVQSWLNKTNTMMGITPQAPMPSERPVIPQLETDPFKLMPADWTGDVSRAALSLGTAAAELPLSTAQGIMDLPGIKQLVNHFPAAHAARQKVDDWMNALQGNQATLNDEIKKQGGVPAEIVNHITNMAATTAANLAVLNVGGFVGKGATVRAAVKDAAKLAALAYVQTPGSQLDKLKQAAYMGAYMLTPIPAGMLPKTWQAKLMNMAENVVVSAVAGGYGKNKPLADQIPQLAQDIAFGAAVRGKGARMPEVPEPPVKHPVAAPEPVKGGGVPSTPAPETIGVTKPPEVAPTVAELPIAGDKAVYPIGFNEANQRLEDAKGRPVDAQHNLIVSPPIATKPETGTRREPITTTTANEAETLPSGARGGARKPELPTDTAKSLGAAAAMPEPKVQMPRFLERALGGIRTLWNSMPIRREMIQEFDAAQNMPVIGGEQVGKGISIGLSEKDRSALNPIIASGRNKAALDDYQMKVQEGIDKWKESGRGVPKELQTALDAVNHARDNWDRLQPATDKAQQAYSSILELEHSKGINTAESANYEGQHIYDRDYSEGYGRPYVLGGGGGEGLGTSFKKGRTFPTVFHAIAEGYVPKSLDVAALAEHRVKLGLKLVMMKEWANAMKESIDPTDKNSVVGEMVQRQTPAGTNKDGTPKFRTSEAAPLGYQIREIIPGVRVAIHEGYAGLFDALTGQSHAPQALLAPAGLIKHGLLLFDTFHASRIAQRMLFLTGKVAYRKGNALLEYADADLAEAVKNNDITQEMADYAKQYRPMAQMLIKSGLNVGRVQELLYSSLTRNVQQSMAEGLSKAGAPKWLAEKVEFNKWVFDKLTRGAMLQSGIIEFERVKKLNPTMSDEQVALQVSRHINQMFGNLGRQGVFQSKTMVDMSRLVGLAPQWVESMARTELGGYKQVGQSLVKGQSPFTQTLGKGVGQGLLAYFAGTQILNLVTRGNFTWDNPEKEHKMDAWIPDITGKTNGFFLSPFSVVAELTHDMIRYTQSEGDPLTAAAKILGNKESPMVRAGQVLTTGYNPNKEKIRGVWRRIEEAGVALAPVPIPLSATIKGSDYPGQIQRQLTASAGVKTEPAMTSSARIHKLAETWLEKRGLPIGQQVVKYEGEGYSDIAYSLRRGDKRAVAEHLADLRKDQPDSKILSHFQRTITAPYTGSGAKEGAFMATLGEWEKGQYRKARADKMAALKLLQEVIRENPRQAPPKRYTQYARQAKGEQ